MQGYEKGKGRNGAYKPYSYDSLLQTVEEAKKVIAEMEKRAKKRRKGASVLSYVRDSEQCYTYR